MQHTIPKRSRKIKTIAFVCSSISSFKFLLLSGVTRYAQERHGIAVLTVKPDDVRDKAILSNCNGIIVNVPYRNVIETLTATGLPIVDTGCEFDDIRLVGVDFDLAKHGVMAAEWFLRRGFRNFGYCGHSGCSRYRSSDVLERSFTETVAKAGCTCSSFDASYLESKDCGITSLLPRLEAWIRTLPRRTAVFCVHDDRAYLFLQACLRLGRAVPDDIAIMGRFNDTEVCTSAQIPITSIDVDVQGLGYAAMRILDRTMRFPAKPKRRRTFLIPPIGIVERESTAVYPVDSPYIKRALVALEGNLDKPISSSKLAEAAGVSPSTLNAAFRKAFGTSVGKYALSVKMSEAKRLAATGRFSVKEIASKTGFSSQAHFSNAYRAFYGRPPSRDRLPPL